MSETQPPGGALSPPDPILAARMDRARQRSVMIATPIARNPVWQYTQSILSTVATLHGLGIRVTWQFVIGSSVIHKARNELCGHFLMSDYSDLLFVDDDMEWSAGDVVRLLASDKPVIGAAGRMRIEKPNADPTVWCWRPDRGGDGDLIQDDMGALRAKGVGAAFLMINRGILHRMALDHPDWKRPGASDWPQDLRDHYFEFFRPESGPTGEMSEDYVFCERVRADGGEVWVDPTIGLGHVGSFNYRGKLEEILEGS